VELLSHLVDFSFECCLLHSISSFSPFHSLSFDVFEVVCCFRTNRSASLLSGRLGLGLYGLVHGANLILGPCFSFSFDFLPVALDD
jgi:hypothetical protein